MRKKLNFTLSTFAIILIVSFIEAGILRACDVPGSINASNVTSSSLLLTWDVISGANQYIAEYRINGTTSWIAIPAATNLQLISELQPGTVYEVNVQAVCATDSSEFSPIETFTTLLPTPDHIVICIMENKDYYQIVDTSAAPYINSLIDDSGTALFAQSFAIEHPSFPNYLDLYSGNNQGITQDTCMPVTFTTENLGNQLIIAGKSFTSYCEDLPSVGYSGCATGNYVKKHNAAVYWQGTSTNQIPSTANQTFSAFPASSDYSSLPALSFVIPNKINDMHSGTIEEGDTWLQNNLDNYIQWAKMNNSLFIFTFDEDDDSPNNQIPTFFTGAMVKHGIYNEAITHFSVLRTIEEMYGLQYAGAAASAVTITGCWKSIDSTVTSSAIPFPNMYDSVEVPMLHIFPNPVSSETLINITLPEAGTVTLDLFNLPGEHMYSFIKNNSVFLAGNHSFTFPALSLITSPGIYFLRLITSEKIIDQKVIIE